MNIIRDIKNAFLRWKLWGTLTIIVLAVSYTLGTHSVVQIIGGYYILGEALSYAGYVLFWLSVLSFVYAWFSGKIKFPKLLTKWLVVSLIPSMIVIYVFGVAFLLEEFTSFSRFSEPLFIIWEPLYLLVLYASLPFYSFLNMLGLWVFMGPTLFGGLLVLAFYSVGIYLLWSGLPRMVRRKT